MTPPETDELIDARNAPARAMSEFVLLVTLERAAVVKVSGLL